MSAPSADADLLQELRTACARVAAAGRHVRIEEDRLDAYAAALAPVVAAARMAPPDPEAELLKGGREARTAFWLCLDAINFGSGWFPTLRKRPGRSGYFAVAIGLREWFEHEGTPAPQRLQDLEAETVAAFLGQEPGHPLMALFAEALRALGSTLVREYGGSVLAPVDRAEDAAAFVGTVARWPAFADAPLYDGLAVPFAKRAQILAADLHRSALTPWEDLHRLTIFADNLVPHVLRLDGVLTYAPALAAAIERGELLPYGSAAEVELRACAIEACERLVARLPGVSAAGLDLALWNRGQAPDYRRMRRHRTRCTAY